MKFSKKEAFFILKATTEEEALDGYENQIFEFKQKYLRVVPPVKLIKSQIQKIERLNLAANWFIDFKTEAKILIQDKIDQSLSLQNVFKVYQKILMNLKFEISRAHDGYVLILLLEQLILLETELYIKLTGYIESQNNIDWNTVKISTPIDVFRAEKELKLKDISESEIMDYLRTIIENEVYPFVSDLANLVLKANKILKHDNTGNL